MLKRIACICMVFCMTILTVPVITYAQTISSISSNTVITKDNLFEVLEYLGIDSSEVIKTDNVGDCDITVGDLKKYIEQAKKHPKEIVINQIQNTEKSKTDSSSADSSFSSSALLSGGLTGVGTLMLYNLNLYGGCRVSYSVSASYAYGSWKSVNYGNASVSSETPGVTNVLTSQTNVMSCTNTTITLTSTVDVEQRIGIAGYGIPFNSFRVTSTMYWYRDSYLAVYA